MKLNLTSEQKESINETIVKVSAMSILIIKSNQRIIKNI